MRREIDERKQKRNRGGHRGSGRYPTNHIRVREAKSRISNIPNQASVIDNNEPFTDGHKHQISFCDHSIRSLSLALTHMLT